MRQLLSDRQLFHGRAGTIIPLSGRTKADPTGTRWLLPAFPLDYVIDLVELVELAQRLEVPLEAMSDAMALIESWRLPEGGWPLLGTRRIADAYRPEQVNRRRPSPITTRRILHLME